MEKQEIDRKIPYELQWEYGVPLSVIKHDIEQLEKLGVTHINIDHGVSYDCSFVVIEAIERGIETDEEFEKRKEEQELYDERTKQTDLAFYERIKTKYKLQ